MGKFLLTSMEDSSYPRLGFRPLESQFKPRKTVDLDEVLRDPRARPTIELTKARLSGAPQEELDRLTREIEEVEATLTVSQGAPSAFAIPAQGVRRSVDDLVPVQQGDRAHHSGSENGG